MFDLGEEIIDKILSRNVDEVVVRIHENIYEDIVFDNGDLKHCSFSKVCGIGLTVYVGDFVGHSYTTRFDDNSVFKMVDEIVSIGSREKISRDRSFSDVGSRKMVYRSSVKINPLDVDIEQKIALVKELNKNSMIVNNIVSAVTRYGFEKSRKIIVSSFGGRAEVDVSMVGIYHMVVAKYMDVVERIFDQKSFVGGYEFIDRYDWHGFVDELNKLVLDCVKASTIKPGVYSVVVDSDLIGLMLHEVLGHAVEGDNVYTDSSVLKNRIGEVVADENVFIVDEGIVSGGYPVPCDDEGIAKNRTYVVKNGMLVNYLHSFLTARKMNHSLTGNARAQDVTHYPIARQTNLYMLPGDASIEELVEDIDYGLYLRGISAGGGQVNSALGTFTFGAGPSYVIRKGEISELVRSVVVSGNILDVLRDIEMIGKNVEIKTSVFGGCSKHGQMVRVGFGGPSVRIKKLVVGLR